MKKENAQYLRFNSTTVQLIRLCSPTFLCYVLFQFHNGTINTEVSVAPVESVTSFNSTTVQLIRIYGRKDGRWSTRFQFHNGTINTLVGSDKRFLALCFNSTTVQLILFSSIVSNSDFDSFNSTTVQLIPRLRG